jgi:hypothetical protein
MLTQTKSQAVLFSEPNYSETGVWVELSEGIDPSEWAHLCRFIGKMSPKEFSRVKKKIYGNPDGIIERFKRLFIFEQSEYKGVPFVQLGCEGIRNF